MAYYTVAGIVKRGVPVLFIAAVISTMSGQMLHAGQEMLINFPVLLILIPPLAKIGGDTGSILGARLSSAFHLGLVEPIGGVVVRNSIFACLVIGFVSCIVLSVAVWAAALLLGIKAAYSLLLAITLIAGCIEMTVVFVATTGIAFISYKHGLDPDDVVIPLITAIGDIVGVASVFAAVRIVW